eukprot:403372139
MTSFKDNNQEENKINLDKTNSQVRSSNQRNNEEKGSKSSLKSSAPSESQKIYKYDERMRKAQNLLIFMATCLILDYFLLQDLLFHESIKHSQYLRKNYPSKNFDLFCQIVSELCDKYGISVVLFICYQLLDHPKSFTISVCTAFGQGLICMLKSLNNEPRPFFVADLKPYKCRLEHGNPSGHTLIVVALYACAVQQFIRQYSILRRNKTLVWTGYIVVAGFIGFGRIYNGVHTHNQVIAGYIWGFATYYTFTHLLQYEIYQFIMNVKNKSFPQLIWNPFTQGFVICYLVQVGLYFYGSKNNPTPQLWLDNIVKNCENVDLHADPELQNFEKYNISFSLIGALLGISIEQRIMGTSQFHDFFKTSPSTTFKRLIVGGSIGLGNMVPFLVSKHNSFWIVLLCRNIVPVVFGSIHIFGLSKYFTYRFGLINETVREGISYEEVMGQDDQTEQEEIGQNKNVSINQNTNKNGKQKQIQVQQSKKHK